MMFFNLVVMLMVLSWTHLWMSLKCWQQNWMQWFSSSHRGNTASLFLLNISQITYKPLTTLSCAAVISLLFVKLITSRNKTAFWFLILICDLPRSTPKTLVGEALTNLLVLCLLSLFSMTWSKSINSSLLFLPIKILCLRQHWFFFLIHPTNIWC